MLLRFLKKYWILLLCVYFGGALLCTLAVQGRSLQEWVALLVSPGWFQDVLMYPLQHHHPVTFVKFLRLADTMFNLSLFVPVGMAIFWGLHRFFPESIRMLLFMSLCTGILLSAGIETLQARIPQRVPSVSDVVANAGGAVLGCYVLYVRFVWKSRHAQSGRTSSSEES